MIPSRSILPIVSLLLLAARIAFAAPPVGKAVIPTGESARRAAFALRPDEYIPVNRLTPGMKGFGLTVFQGTKIERFDVTVLGVLKKANNGHDLIIVKVGGGGLRRVTDIIAGMSGSPVYVDGKLIGAVSMGDSFTKESIGYLTPIADMLEALDPALPQSEKIAPLPAGLIPLKTAVGVSGISPLRFASVVEKLSKLGLEARQSGGLGGMLGNKPVKGSDLVPGGAVGMSLATGDLDLTAIGTVTYRRGNSLVAFGHPFLGLGALEAPMFSAYIHEIEPSYNVSSKIGSPVTLKGSFLQDRPWSVAGRIGAPPFMIPVTVMVNDRAQRRDRAFHAKIVRHPQITGQLLDIAANAAITQIHGQPGNTMANVSFEVVADDVGIIKRSNRVFSATDIGDASTAELLQLVSNLAQNNLYPVGIRSVKMNVQIEPGRKTAQIERIFLKQTRFEPGETVAVGVVLKPYKLPRVVRTIELRLPPSLPSGVYPLSLQSGASANPSGGGLSLLAALLGGGPSGTTANSVTVRQIVQRFLERNRNDELVAKLSLPTPAVNVQGEKLTNLPPTLDTALRSARTSSIRLERDEIKKVYPTEYVLSGSQTVTLRVARKNEPERAAYIPFSPLGNGTTNGSANPNTPSSATGGSARPITPSDDDDENNLFALNPNRIPLAVEPLQIPTRPASPKQNDGDSSPDSDTVPSPNNASAKNNAEITAKSVTRAPGLWQQSSAQDFRAGTTDGVTITSRGEISPSRRLTKIAESDVPYFWSMCDDGTKDGKGLFVGAGDNGAIYRLQNGTLIPYAQTGELMVHSLVRGTDGSLYAGTSPNGRVYRIGADGKPVPIYKAPDKYILALALSKDERTLYIGTGGGRGHIYALPLNRKAEAALIYSGDEAHITALAISPNGALYAGTAPGGLVIRIDETGADKTAKVVYDAAEPAVSGITWSGDSLYVATMPRGNLYKISPQRAPRPLLDRTITNGAPYLPTLTNPITDKDGTVYTASGGTLYAIDSDGTVRLYETPTDIQMLALHKSADGKIYAATGNVAGIYALGDSKTSSFTSSILDARGVAKWGTVRWNGSGTNLQLQTRSGDTSDPNSDWSDWSKPYTDPTGEKIISPPARYLQYRAVFTDNGSEIKDRTALRSVEAFYLPPNQPPTLTLQTPHGGEAWHGTKTIRWSSADADKDILSYTVSLSADNGITWLPAPLKTTAKVDDKSDDAAIPTRGDRKSSIAAKAKSAPKPSAINSLQSELSKHPEMSDELKAQILRDAPDAKAENTVSSGDSAKAVPVNGTTRETTYALDTTKLPDGIYRLRVIASDAPSNGTNALTTEKISGELRIVNRLPVLTVNEKLPIAEAGQGIQLSGQASQRFAAIRGVQWRLDNSEWTTATATDALFDSPTEGFTLQTLPLTKGKHRIDVQAIDEAGNAATVTVSVTVN